jgi:carboxyl-terminal processing protease
MTVGDVVDRIRGPEGVPVLLTIERNGEDARRVFLLVREKVLVPSVESALMPDDVGWIKIDHFSKKTSIEFQRHVDTLRAAGGAGSALRGLVVDLRGNTGGSMIHAARIVNAFVDEGRLLRTEGRNGGKVRGLTHTIDAKKEFKRFSGPVVVLVDRRTASGSEIVAGGLKFMNRGLVLGTQTFGKGTVQKLYKLEKNKSMKLTVARYLLPGDAFINSVGVTPDLVVGEYRLDPHAPLSPDMLREPAQLQGRKEGKGGLDAKRNPGAGREPTSGGTNARPVLRLVHPRVLAEWGGPAEVPAPNPGDHADSAEGDDWTLAADVDSTDRPAYVSTGPGDDGDDRFNDLQLRLAFEILRVAPIDAGRDRLIEIATPLVAEWQTRQSTRLARSFAARNLRWGVQGTGAWMDRAPADEPARQEAMLGEPPPLEATLEFAETLAAEETIDVRLEVINTSGSPHAHLRGLLQSSSKALDDRTFLIGDLEPGARATWTIPIQLSSKAASRLDEWRLYLVGDDGPLGGPFRDLVSTRGLPVPRFHIQASSQVRPQEDGTTLVTAVFDIRNDGPGDAGEVRVRLGDPRNTDVERVEQFHSIDELNTHETKRAELTLRVRNPAATQEVSVRARISDLRTGTYQILSLRLPTTAALDPAEFILPADVQFTQPPEDEVMAGKLEGVSPFAVAGEVTAQSGLKRVEVFLGRDKLFVAEAPPDEERAPQTVTFEVSLTLSVGPNRLWIRATTDQGMESIRTIWILGL